MAEKHLIVAGNAVPPAWDFRRGMEAATGQPWEVICCPINEYDGLKKYTRYLKYAFFPFYLLAVRGRYDVIVSWEQFFGLVMAYYLRLVHARSCPPIDVMTFIYRPKKGLVGRIYEHFVRTAVTSRYIRRICVFGQSEIAHYMQLFGLPREKFVAETLGVEDVAAQIEAMPPVRTDSFYLSAGRSNRDYDFLRSVWDETHPPLCIVCDVETAEDTANIHYEKDRHGPAYLRLLADSRAVVVPLRSRKFSSGQLVVLQTAMLGKPIIVTENDTIRDYVEDGVTGFIIEKTPQALENALQKLEDPALYAQMCRAARRKFETSFSLYELGRRVGERTPC